VALVKGSARVQVHRTVCHSADRSLLAPNASKRFSQPPPPPSAPTGLRQAFVTNHIMDYIGSATPLRRFRIKVPSTSANIGPGFDVVGLSLSLSLTLDVFVGYNDPLPPTPGGTRVPVELIYTGEGAKEVPLDPYKNLLTRIALYVLRCHDIYVGNIKSHPCCTGCKQPSDSPSVFLEVSEDPLLISLRASYKQWPECELMLRYVISQ
jgi:hypothetical protein